MSSFVFWTLTERFIEGFKLLSGGGFLKYGFNWRTVSSALTQVLLNFQPGVTLCRLKTIDGGVELTLSFNQDSYFCPVSSHSFPGPADFTGQGTIQKALISFPRLMSSQASYKLFCQSLTLSHFLPGRLIVWVWAQQGEGGGGIKRGRGGGF